MNIELIENGMELSQVREILNAVIQKVNGEQTPAISYRDLADRPCINGVELTAATTAKELNLTLSQLSNTQEIETLVTQIGTQKASETARSELSSKLDSDFSTLRDLKYNFDENMLLTIGDGSEIYKTTVHDLLLYLKYLILQDSTFERVASGGRPLKDENSITEDTGEAGGNIVEQPPTKP
jgi:hypothetical protein